MDKIYVVMEYMENELKNLMENMEEGFSVAQIKCLFKQLLEAVAYMHGRFIIHRDLKTSNILFNKDGILKVCDFGLARSFNAQGRPPSPNVVTLWYRCPELLVG
jgi:cell division cycle 2-like protein